MNAPPPRRRAGDGRLHRRQAARACHSILAILAAGLLRATAPAAAAGGAVPPTGSYTLTVIVDGSGSVTRDPQLPFYPPGSTVQLTALPASNWTFAGWSGGASGNDNPTTVLMDGSRTITATFTPPLLTPSAAVFPNYSLVLPPAAGDYDNDGFVDLPLYHNRGDGTFEEIPGFRDILNGGNFHGASWCDYDRDGDLDLALLPYEGVETPGVGAGVSSLSGPATTGKAHLFRNDGGTFVDVAPFLGMDKVGFAETAVWADFDSDGWPDLFAPFYTHLPPYQSFYFRNLHDGTFSEEAAQRGVDLVDVPEALKVEGAHAVDIDDDGDLDLYAASHLFLNDGNGYFTDARAEVGLPAVFDEGAMFVDYDNDGDLDLSLRVESRSRLYRNDGGLFLDVTQVSGLPEPGINWGDSWADVDNDGDLDHYIARPGFQPGILMLNQGNSTFVQDETFQLLDSSGLSSWADFDNDGDLDLHVEGYDRHLFENTRDQRPGFAGSYLRVQVLGVFGHKTQQGATVRLRKLSDPPGVVQTRVVDGGSGYLTQSEYVVHFGVDPSATYSLEVSFPSRPDARVIVGSAQVAWLGAIVPGSLGGQLVTVLKDGRAHLGDWTITAWAGENGAISPAGTVMVTPSHNQPFTITPAVGYRVVDVVVDGTSVGPVSQYTFASVSRKHTISATFEVSTHPIAIDVTGPGHVDKDPDASEYLYGTTVTLTAEADPGYTFIGWSGDATGNTPQIEVTVNHDLDIDARFGLPRFVESNMTFPPYGAGGLPPAWGDFDHDGDLDLPLYRNEANNLFSEINGVRDLLAGGNYHGGAWCDYDRDGDLDLWIQPYTAQYACHGLLLRNEGDETFESVSPGLGLDVSGLGATPTWADFDGDGWPDLFSPFYGDAPPYRSYLWHNNGNGTFTDVAAAAGADLSDLPPDIQPEGTATGDYDDDGDVDLYCAGYLLQNHGDGTFVDVRAQSGLPLVQDGAARFVDYDRDGDLDLSLRTHSGPALFRNDAGLFTDVTQPAGLAGGVRTWGDNWADVDNDGDVDAYLASPAATEGRLMLNQGDGTFIPDEAFRPPDSSGPSAWADVDRDGDLDLHVQGNYRHVFRNLTDLRLAENVSHLRVMVLDAQGRQTQHGATVRLGRLDGPPGVVQAAVVDGGSGYLGQNQYGVHFGVTPGGTYALSVSFPSPPSARIVVDAGQVAWLGAIVPANLASHAITVYRNQTAHLGDWTITTSAGSGGTVSPSGVVPVDHGASRSFAITPAPGHHIVGVRIDGNPQGALSAYTFVNVNAHHSLEASFASTTDVGDRTPVPLGLEPVLPNPVRHSARIAFGLPAASTVHLDVVDLQGRIVATLASGERPAGRHHVTWEGRGLPAGLYFVTLRVGDRRLVRRLALAR